MLIPLTQQEIQEIKAFAEKHKLKFTLSGQQEVGAGPAYTRNEEFLSLDDHECYCESKIISFEESDKILTKYKDNKEYNDGEFLGFSVFPNNECLMIAHKSKDEWTITFMGNPNDQGGYSKKSLAEMFADLEEGWSQFDGKN